MGKNQRTKFSANLGFLWTELELPNAIRAAKQAGFDAVEFHYPYDYSAFEIREVLVEAGLVCLGLNTRRGDVDAGDMGLAGLPGREVEAREAIEEAVAYGAKIQAGCVHVMAGNCSGDEAGQVFVENLKYACELAVPHGLDILIEPLNTVDAPGYLFSTTGEAEAIIDEVGANNLKLMFDCYHVARMEGDVGGRLRKLMPLIGHIQFAGVPDRGEPDRGEVDYAEVFNLLADLGYSKPLGAEYRSSGPVEASLQWMDALR